MATYLQGLTDYIPQIQPFKPDYNFLGNILQASQSRYDSNYKQLSEQYGTLLNSAMMREDNNKQRQEFFKIIDQDIKKMSTMDLSLQKNVDAATRVFDSFYKNKYMVDDMVKTRKYQQELSKAESFKNCHDPKKCGGMYWEEGVDYLKYKAQEYTTANREESLSLDIGTYKPFFNWKPEALKLAKDQDMSVSVDNSNGKYIVHDKNGKLVQGGLYQVFSEVYGDDPRVKDNYDVEAYVARNKYVDNKAEEFGSRELAEKDWLDKTLKQGNAVLYEQKADIERANNEVSARLARLDEKSRTIGLTPEEQDVRNALPDMKAKLDATNERLTNRINSLSPYTKELRLLRSQSDNAYSQVLLDKDLRDIAISSSLRDVQHKLDVDEYGLAGYQSQLRREENAQQFEYDKLKISYNLQADMSLEQFKHGLENGMFDGQDGLSTSKSGDVGGTEEQATSYGTDNTILEDHPDAFYNMNKDVIDKRVAEGKQSSADFLYNAFLTAKRAAKDPGKNPGAVAYLEAHYGKDWNNITNLNDLIRKGAKKGTVVDLFNSTVGYLDQNKNPYGNLDWANSLMSSNAKNIANLKILNSAGGALLRKHAETNKKIARDISKLSTDGKLFYKDADLLVSKSGVALVSDEMPSEFARNFMSRYNMFTGAGYKVAEKTYKALRDKFLDVYNHSKEVSLQQGVGLDGGGALTSSAMRYAGIDASKYASGYLHKARLYADAAVDKSGYVSYVLGNPDKDSLNDLSKDEQAVLGNFMKVFQNDLRSKWTKTDGKRPMFSMTEMPIAGNNKDLSAVKFDISPEYLSTYIGSKENNKLLWSLKDKLANGITMVYDNKKVSTPATRGIMSSAYEDLIKTQGVTYDVPNAGKIQLSYDNSTGKIMLEQEFVKHDPKTGRKYIDYKPSIPLPPDTKLDENYHNMVLNQLDNMRIYNEQFDQQVAQFYRDK